MYKNSLIINSLETEREKHFQNKLKFFLNYYPKERIIEDNSSLNAMNDLFTDDTINFVDVFHILTKKYYLSSVVEDEINQNFNNAMTQLDFRTAHNLLLTNEKLRKLLLYTYIDNIDNSNIFLAVEKTSNDKYDEVNKTLEELDNFYLISRFTDIKNHQKILKKEYN